MAEHHVVNMTTEDIYMMRQIVSNI
jgi:hypothetical protein